MNHVKTKKADKEMKEENVDPIPTQTLIFHWQLY